MSLEDKIEKLTAAVEKLTEQMETVLNTDVGAAVEGEEKPKRTRRTKAEIEAEKKLLEAKADVAEAKVAAHTGSAEEPAAEEPKAVEPAVDAGAVAPEKLKEKLSGWLSEFPKEHPEQLARREKLKELFVKLKAANLTEVLADAAKVASLDKWFETKAKTWDEGHGIGRFAADPAPAAAADEMEEL